MVSPEEFSHQRFIPVGDSVGETTNMFWISLGESSRRGSGEACSCLHLQAEVP